MSLKAPDFQGLSGKAMKKVKSKKRSAEGDIENHHENEAEHEAADPADISRRGNKLRNAHIQHCARREAEQPWHER